MGDNRKIIEFTPGKEFRSPPKRRRKKPVEVTTKSKDPRLATADRTFEIVRCYPLGGGDSIIERRIRLRIVGKGGLEDEIYEVGGQQAYVGMVSEQLAGTKGRDNWSPYTWGHVPVQGVDWAREIINDDPLLKATKKDDNKDDRQG